MTFTVCHGKIHPPILKFGKPSISIRAIYTMVMLNNQRVCHLLLDLSPGHISSCFSNHDKLEKHCCEVMFMMDLLEVVKQFIVVVAVCCCLMFLPLDQAYWNMLVAGGDTQAGRYSDCLHSIAWSIISSHLLKHKMFNTHHLSYPA